MPKERLDSVTGGKVGAGRATVPASLPPASAAPLSCVPVSAPPASLPAASLELPLSPAPASDGTQVLAVEDEFLGLTVPALRSAALLSVSVQPPPARESEVVLVRVGAGPLPSKLAADDP